MGTGELWPPTESKPLNRLRKSVTVDYVRDTKPCANLGAIVQILPRTASRQMGEI